MKLIHSLNILMLFIAICFTQSNDLFINEDSLRAPAQETRRQRRARTQRFSTRKIKKVMKAIYSGKLKVDSLKRHEKRIYENFTTILHGVELEERKKAMHELFGGKDYNPSEIEKIFHEITDLADKLDSFTFINTDHIKSLIEVSEVMIDSASMLVKWELADRLDITDLNSIANKFDTASAIAGGDVNAIADGVNEVGKVALDKGKELSKGLRSYALKYGTRIILDYAAANVMSEPGTAITADHARPKLIIIYLRQIELLAFFEKIGDKEGADKARKELVSQSVIVARHLAGLTQTPSGIFPNLEFRSAIGLFFRDLNEPKQLLQHIKKNVTDIHYNTALEVDSFIETCVRAVDLTQSELEMNAKPGIIKQTLKFFGRNTMTVADYSIMGMTVFKKLSEDFLDDMGGLQHAPVFNESFMLLNGLIRSTQWVGTSATTMLEQVYAVVGHADPEWRTLTNWMNGGFKNMNSCFKRTRSFLKYHSNRTMF